MRISDWSSDVCSSDLSLVRSCRGLVKMSVVLPYSTKVPRWKKAVRCDTRAACCMLWVTITIAYLPRSSWISSSIFAVAIGSSAEQGRSEEHTSELQSLMRISYAVFCLKKKNRNQDDNTHAT